MASSDLTWTLGDSTVNQIDEYWVYRSRKTASETEYGDFSRIARVEVDRDWDGTITNETAATMYTDSTVDFSTYTYCYRVDAMPVFVGEAEDSPQTPVGPSNIVYLGTKPTSGSGDLVLSGVKDGADVDLSWTASTPGLNPIVSYLLYRSVDDGDYSLLATIASPTLVYTDTDVTLNSFDYKYFVVALDAGGLTSDDSNIVNIPILGALMVAVANSGASTFRVMTSTDAINWTSRSIVNQPWEDVAYSESLQLFIMVCGSGTDRIAKSSDAGVTDPWTLVTGEIQTGEGIGITWAPSLDLFAIVFTGTSQSNGFRIATSPDGLNWTYQTTPATADISWNSIEWFEDLGLFVCTSNAHGGVGYVMTSSDGVTWTHGTTPLTSGRGGNKSAHRAGGTAIRISNGADIGTFKSDDSGATWIASAPTGLFHGTNGISVNSSVYVVCTSDPFYSGPDGVGWFARTGFASAWVDTTWSPLLQLFVAIATGGTKQVATSIDGSTWVEQVTPLAGSWQRIIEGKVGL